MHLAGQGNQRNQRSGSPARDRFDDEGYILVAMLVGIAVGAVWMSALLPAWRQQATREKEAELVFRGEQYARAIVLYRRKLGSLPPNIDILVSQRYLRKKYRDPIADGDFVPVGGLQTTQLPGQPPAGRGGAAQAGITGVRSTSTQSSIKVYYNQQTYSQWPFDWTTMAARMGDTSAQPQGPTPGRGGPGAPGRGAQPGELAPIAPGGARGRQGPAGRRGDSPQGSDRPAPRGFTPGQGPSFGGRQ
jgi:type II secretory pathway pseudopilin PulG